MLPYVPCNSLPYYYLANDFYSHMDVPVILVPAVLLALAAFLPLLILRSKDMYSVNQLEAHLYTSVRSD